MIQRKNTVLGIIPARYHSTRLPQKMLRKIGNKTLIQHVWDRCSQTTMLDTVIIATDHEAINDVVKQFGGTVVLTDPNHQSGTDRAVEVAAAVDCDVVINIQGDEPFISPHAIDALASAFEGDEHLKVATLCHRETDPAVLCDPNVVKVVFDKQGFALYFSRAPIPYDREGARGAEFFKHIGIYAFRKDFLMTYSRLAASSLETREKLEQLRILDNGEKIKVIETDFDSCGIDTEEDLRQAEKLYVEMTKERS